MYCHDSSHPHLHSLLHAVFFFSCIQFVITCMVSGRCSYSLSFLAPVFRAFSKIVARMPLILLFLLYSPCNWYVHFAKISEVLQRLMDIWRDWKNEAWGCSHSKFCPHRSRHFRPHQRIFSDTNIGRHLPKAWCHGASTVSLSVYDL